MSLADDACVRACLNEHPEAFRHLVRRYQTPLTRYLRGRLGSGDLAAEAAQETFVRAYFALGELRKPEAFFCWLVGIADRVAKEMRRTARRCLSIDLEQFQPPEPSGHRESREETATSEAVAKLPEIYREVVVLRYYGGHSCAEISRSLGVPLGTVTKRLSRAYSLLRERLRGKLHAENEVQR
jgi:RNA polymerase sigma factor (sigma-70 family)